MLLKVYIDGHDETSINVKVCIANQRPARCGFKLIKLTNLVSPYVI